MFPFGPMFGARYFGDSHFGDEKVTPRVKYDPKATPEERRTAALASLASWAAESRYNTLILSTLAAYPEEVHAHPGGIVARLPFRVMHGLVDEFRSASDADRSDRRWARDCDPANDDEWGDLPGATRTMLPVTGVPRPRWSLDLDNDLSALAAQFGEVKQHLHGPVVCTEKAPTEVTCGPNFIRRDWVAKYLAGVCLRVRVRGEGVRAYLPVDLVALQQVELGDATILGRWAAHVLLDPDYGDAALKALRTGGVLGFFRYALTTWIPVVMVNGKAPEVDPYRVGWRFERAVRDLEKRLSSSDKLPTGKDVHFARTELPGSLSEVDAEEYRVAAERVLQPGEEREKRLRDVAVAAEKHLACRSLNGLRLSPEQARAYRTAAYNHLLADECGRRWAMIDTRMEGTVDSRYHGPLPEHLTEPLHAEVYREVAEKHLGGAALAARLRAIDEAGQRPVSQAPSPKPEAPQKSSKPRR